MITVCDLFCGAGGSGLGATSVPGVRLQLAANHWRLAIETHAANFPDTEHDVADISQVDPRRYRRTNILWASPECFAGDTLVVTERGLTPIKEVVVGDQVITHRGRYRTVLGVAQRESSTVRLVGQGLSRGLEVTGNHKLWTRLGGDDPHWRRVDEFQFNEFWATPRVFPPGMVPPIIGRRPIHVDDTRFAWTVGRWLGDGSLRIRPKGSDETFISCGNHDAEDLEKHLSWIHHSCDTCAPELTWSRRQLRTAVVFANSHSELAQWLTEHFGQKAHGKTIPAWALGAPREWREALLAGYVSSDGHDTGRGITATTVSKRLAIGIRLLAESLGHRTQLHYSARRDSWHIEGRTGPARPQWIVSWLHDEVRPRSFADTLHTWSPVKDRVPASDRTVVYDLMVDEDHSFVADGIVVHNCTWHSGARGQRRDDGEPDLFGDILPAEAGVRSRSTMFDVHRFAEYHHYDAIIVENVVEAFTKWSLRRSWFLGLEDLGYDWRVVSLNSMHAPAIAAPRAPQSRDRAYCVAWKRGNRAPDLEIRPAAWCAPCNRRVEAVQWWKRQTARPVGKYRAQYLYRCTLCHQLVEPDALPASTIIDWTLRGQRIGDRAVPLRPATLARIQAGLDRYAVPTLVPAGGTWNDEARPVTEPMRARTTRETEGLLVPVEGREGKQAQPAETPMRTQTARHETALVVPYYGNGYARPADEPLPTQSTRDRFGLAFVGGLRGGGSKARDVQEPLATVTASGNHHMLVRHNTVRGDGGYLSTPVSEPARTLTTAGHQSLVGWSATPPAIEDCTFRMLAVPEIAGAMAFTPDYRVLGNKRERVRQLGNAVTPCSAEILIRRVVASLNSGDAA